MEVVWNMGKSEVMPVEDSKMIDDQSYTSNTSWNEDSELGDSDAGVY